MKTKKDFKTTAAYVANVLKLELKAKFPTVKFSVRSEVFAGGDSIDVGYSITLENFDTTAGIYKEVNEITKKYVGGSFDGMTDSYNYDNTKNYDTVKYTFVRPDVDKEVNNLLAEKAGKELNIKLTDYYGGYLQPEQYAERHWFYEKFKEYGLITH